MDLDKSIYMIYGVGFLTTVIVLMTLDATILRKTYSNKRTFILQNDILTYGNSIPKGDLQESTLWTGLQYHVIAAIVVTIIWTLLNFFSPSLHKMLADHVSR